MQSEWGALIWLGEEEQVIMERAGKVSIEAAQK